MSAKNFIAFHVTDQLAEMEDSILIQNPHFKKAAFRSMVFELGLIKFQQQQQSRKK